MRKLMLVSSLVVVVLSMGVQVYACLPPPPPPCEIEIDVKPYSDPNNINAKSNGLVSVGVFSSGGFDATLLESIGLGDPATGVAVGPVKAGVADLNGDGKLDLLLHFSVPELFSSGALTKSSTKVALTALYLGNPVCGVDAVRILGKPK